MYVCLGYLFQMMQSRDIVPIFVLFLKNGKYLKKKKNVNPERKNYILAVCIAKKEIHTCRA